MADIQQELLNRALENTYENGVKAERARIKRLIKKMQKVLDKTHGFYTLEDLLENI